MHLASLFPTNGHSVPAGEGVVDTSRPISICGNTFGLEAAQEVARILRSGSGGFKCIFIERPIEEPFYWQISLHSGETCEAFGYPELSGISLPSAVEVGIIRALDGTPPEDRYRIFAGGNLIVVGKEPERFEILHPILKSAKRPGYGNSILWNSYQNMTIREIEGEREVIQSSIRCLSSSFEANPIKFRFLELYRAIEARFLSDVFFDLKSSFFYEPARALEDAIKKIKSELEQLTSMASKYPEPFVDIWDVVAENINSNNFCKSLFRKLDGKGKNFKSPKEVAGAAILYYIRCAIVHAGEKDMIFDSFEDGDVVLELIVEHVEKIGLAMAGIHLS